MAITSINQVTTRWLTYVLAGRAVESVKAQKVHVSQVSTSYRLRVMHRDSGETHLFLKMHHQNIPQVVREVQFYRDLVPEMEHPHMIVRCYDAAADADGSHLLLDDLSEHYFNVTEQTPSPTHLETVIDGFAALHGFWWEHPWLGVYVGELPTAQTIAEAETQARIRVIEFVDHVGGLLSSAAIDLLKEVIAVGWHPKRRYRLVNRIGLTVIHRDAHPKQFLYARTGFDARIIDWDAWRVEVGTDDLAYMMSCHWGEKLRAKYERALLQRYHESLRLNGVKGYSMDDVLFDYAASIQRSLSLLVSSWSSRQLARERYIQRIQRGLTAYGEYKHLLQR